MLIFYNGDQLVYVSKQFMIGRENNLLYVNVTSIAPAKEWNENAPKSCHGALNFVGLLVPPMVVTSL